MNKLDQMLELKARSPNPSLAWRKLILLDMHSLWMSLDYRKIYDFDERDRNFAVREIYLALIERNKKSGGKPWTDDKTWQAARNAFGWCQDIKRAQRVEVLEFYERRQLAHVRRYTFMKIATATESPRKRRGRKKLKHLSLVKGGWDGKWRDEIWSSGDILSKGGFRLIDTGVR